MAFCTNCGHQLVDGAKFCFECGTKVSSMEAENSKRKVLYEGVIYKCPICGEILDAFAIACPACGHEIRGKLATNSVVRFSAKFEQAQNEQQQLAVIKNFPIPNTKEDVVEFLILASTNAVSLPAGRIRTAWIAKFEQSYKKAKLLLKEQDMKEVTIIYQEANKKIKASNLLEGTKATGQYAGKFFSKLFNLLFLLLKKIPIIFAVIFRNILILLSAPVYQKAIEVDRLGENAAGWELLGGIFAVISALLLLRKNAGYIDILIVAAAGCLNFYYSQFLENGSLLLLVGVIVIVITIRAFIKRVVSGNKATREQSVDIGG